MQPRQMLVSPDKYAIKCPHVMTAEFIVVHNTANDASANNEISYMRTNNNNVSFHFAVDDKEVVQGLPLNRNGWHAGDGSNGKGNRKGIGIEICYSKSGGAKFDASERNAAKFIAQLLKERGWDISRVKKHQDFSGKYCPHRTLDMGWQRFLNMVQAELNPPKPLPAPSSITYATITPKSIELIRDANMWNFDFTNWSEAKAVKSYAKGTKIDNIVAIATNALGAKYYVSQYSFDKKITNGFNINDAIDYTAPKPVEPPIVIEPDPVEPETPPTPDPTPIEPNDGEDAKNWLIRVFEWIGEMLSKFTYKK